MQGHSKHGLSLTDLIWLWTFCSCAVVGVSPAGHSVPSTNAAECVCATAAAAATIGRLFAVALTADGTTASPQAVDLVAAPSLKPVPTTRATACDAMAPFAETQAYPASNFLYMMSHRPRPGRPSSVILFLRTFT